MISREAGKKVRGRLRKRSRALAAVLVILASTEAIWSCSPEPLAQQSWDQHLSNLELFVDGDSGVTEEEVIGAVRFFKRLTGVEPDLDVQFHMVVPTEDTATDLQRLRDWHASNGHRLSWDAASKRVVLVDKTRP